MSSGSISTLGVGSSLDLQGILDKLRAVDQKAITNKETKKTALQEKLQEFNKLNANLLSMKSSALNLSMGSTFLNRKVTASGTSVTATSLSAAKVMSHSMEVTALASHSSWNSAGVAAKTDSVATANGTFSFKMGATGTAMEIEVPAGTTLQGLADLINDNDSNPGVTATIADTGVGATPFRLVLTSDKTGEESRIFIESQLTELGLTESGGAFHTPPTSDNAVVAATMDITAANNKIVFREKLANGTLGSELTATIPELVGYTPETLATAMETAMEAASLAGGNSIDYSVSFDSVEKKFTIAENGSDLHELSMEWGKSSAAAGLGFDLETDTYKPYDSILNARFTVDSISYQRQSNTGITDVVQGVTLDMAATGTASISVTNDLGDIKTGMQKLVETLNTLKTEIDTENVFNSETQVEGLLYGEHSINRIDDELSSFFGNSITTNSSIKSLFDLGFEINRDGSFTLNETLLDSVLASSPEDVQEFFIGDLDNETKGFGDLLNEKLREYTDSQGLLASETDGTQSQIDRITADIASQTTKLDKRYEIMSKQFVQLDIYMQKMTAQSDFLKQIFEPDSTN